MNHQKFSYSPSESVPFRDRKEIERVLKIKREDLEKHPNPEFKIKVIPDAEIEFILIADMLKRIRESSETGKKLVLILPNPCPTYRHVARLINALNLDCRNLYAFAMDEYADERGNVAPPGWEFSFTYAMFKYFYYNIDERLRPDKRQFTGFTNRNVACYGKMIEDLGGADICYSGPGWTGHLAFIEPDAPEFAAPLDEWKEMSARIVTLSPYTIAQNSLYGTFGKSGNLAAVPPKAATIGPAEVIRAKSRMDTHAITVHGTDTAWQRFISRLVLHGPVTPLVPESILQTLPTAVYVSENIARNIEPDWNKGY
ncbi:MAG: hypothetical protein LBL57_01110 [Tannerella sp.]|jgi:glucosamine-6-phosphate deaminase|nr:hypothetical protein [Tannerella sp.]